MGEFVNILKVLIPILLGVFTVVGWLYKKVESSKDQKMESQQREIDKLDKYQRDLSKQVTSLEAKQVDTDQINRMLDQRLAPMQHQLQQILDILMRHK